MRIEMMTRLLVILFTSLVYAVDPLVRLDYASYQGVALPNGVSQWLGMRYAAPPTGPLRFEAPVDPAMEPNVQAADHHGAICLAVNGNPNSRTTSEDCLFLDLYAPSNAAAGAELPVYFFIQGGGYASNANANMNGSELIQAAGGDIVVVNFNYRVGPYGFLGGKEILAGGSPNNGLKDQRKALQWVQKYIDHFGGDPTHVTLGGASAGGGSAVLQLTAYGGRDDGLFHAVAAEEPSFQVQYSVTDSQFSYDALVQRTGCASASDTLACLKGLSAPELQQYNIIEPLPGGTAPPVYLYGPTIDNDLVQDYTYNLLAHGKFVHVPTIFGDDQYGGANFVPNTTSSQDESNTFLHNNWPGLTQSQLGRIDQLYVPNNVPPLGGGAYFGQLAKVYTDIRYQCSGQYANSASFNASIPTWNYLYNVGSARHTAELNAIWGPGDAADMQIKPIIQGYWTSFIKHFDPNQEKNPNSPTWQGWSSDIQSQLEFSNNAATNQLLTSLHKNRCAYLQSIGPGIGQ